MSQSQRKLTAKQQAFVEAYCAAGQNTYNNATQSAIKAGYSVKTAYSSGQRLLKHVEASKAIAQLRAEIAEKIEVTRDYCVKKLKVVIEATTNERNRLTAISLLGDFAGFKREVAPNLEREVARKAIEAAEAEKLAELARKRTEQESTEPAKPPIRLVISKGGNMEEAG